MGVGKIFSMKEYKSRAELEKRYEKDKASWAKEWREFLATPHASTNMDGWLREHPTPKYPEIEIIDDLSCGRFDDVAPIAIYLGADLQYEAEAKTGLSKLKQSCRHIPQLLEVTPKMLANGEEGDVDFRAAYNNMFRKIVEEDYELETHVDSYGAYCYKDKNGSDHCGDDRGMFPWYLHEKELRKSIDF